MNKVVRVSPGQSWAGRDGLCTMTDREYADKVDNSPRIGEAYKSLGRIGNPMRRACEYTHVFGVRSRIGGTPRGEAPADGIR